MQDKDFLGYFSSLGPQSTIPQLKQASTNIVSTLLAIGTNVTKRRTSSVDENDARGKQLALLHKKYLTGDLGDSMSADLNYALKRLVRGLCSENHTVKKGFFLTTVQVMARFKMSIDSVKLIKFVLEETKTTKMMKNPEVNALLLGQVMCFSAMVESQVYQMSASQVSTEAFDTLIKQLISLYKDHDFLKESVQAVFGKSIKRVTPEVQGAQALDKVVKDLIDTTKYKHWVFAHADKLSLFLTLREIYLERFQEGGMVGAITTKVLTFDIFDQNAYLISLQNNIGKQYYLYPRLHSSLALILNEVYRINKAADRTKLLVKLIQKLFDECLFSEDVYYQIKNNQRPKFLHIGLTYWEMICARVAVSEKKDANREAVLQALLSPHFFRVFVRNCQSQKGPLYELATKAKSTLQKLIEQTQITPDFAQQLLMQFFGPNTLLKLAVRRNQELLKVFASRMKAEQVTSYLESLQSMYNAPSLQEHFPANAATAGDYEQKEETKQSLETAAKKEGWKIEAIQAFCLQQVTQAPALFKHCLESSHIETALSLLVPVAFSPELAQKATASGDSQIRTQAQFKLFSMVQQLQKLKLGDVQKSGLKDSSGKLWLHHVNSKVNSLLKKKEETSSLAHHHKKVLKFVTKKVTPKRIDLTEQVSAISDKSDKKFFVLDVERKRALAFEILLLSLSLVLCIPDDVDQITETLQQIEELQECFGNMRLGESGKPKESASATRKEAFTILFDILVAQLMKSQSFLRDMANYVFKQYCMELDHDTMGNLITIISTPNERGLEMIEGGIDANSESDSSDDSDAEVIEDEEDSQDSDDI